jgi:hypothetical protein
MSWDANDMRSCAAELQPMLSVWDDSTCTVAGYGFSHPTLTIWVHQDPRPTAILIECITPMHMRGKFVWSRCRLIVSVDEAEVPLPVFVLTDEGSGFEVRCRHLRVKDTRPPPWSRAVLEADPTGPV